MEIIEKTLQTVKEHLPLAGTELGIYAFLAPDALWTGMVESQRPFVAVAEDNADMFILTVMADNPVYIAELSGSVIASPNYRDCLDLGNDSLICYCAADFPKFMEIMELYLTASKTLCRLESVLDNEEFEKKCAETEQALRCQAANIDPTAIEDAEGLWSALFEEMGAGMSL